MRPRLVLLPLSFLAFAACGDDDGAVDAGAADLGATFEDAAPMTDTGVSRDAEPGDGSADAGIQDLGVDTGPRTGPCRDRLYDDRNIPLDPAGPTTQIHPSVAFDGDTLWLAYNLPNAEGFFDVYLTRLYCDGEVLLPPLKVTTTESSTIGPNSIDPTILLAHDRVYVFWQWDTGTGIDNLDIVFRVFDRDGAPLDEADRVLALDRAGRPQFVSTWFPKLAPLPDGLALVGAWAHDDAQRFQVFIQRLDVDGVPTQEAFDADLVPTRTQLYPAVATSTDGTILVAWQEEPDDGDPAVRYRFIPPGARSSSSTVTVGGFPSINPNVSIEYGEAMLGLTRVSGNQAGPEIQLLSSSYTQALGLPTRYDHSPIIAREPAAGGVFHFRVQSGIRNQVLFVPFAIDQGIITPSPARLIETTSPAAPYEPAIVNIEPGLYFLAWSEGQSPDLRLFGRFARTQP